MDDQAALKSILVLYYIPEMHSRPIITEYIIGHLFRKGIDGCCVKTVVEWSARGTCIYIPRAFITHV